jgi:hypothetical protein
LLPSPVLASRKRVGGRDWPPPLSNVEETDGRGWICPLPSRASKKRRGGGSNTSSPVLPIPASLLLPGPATTAVKTKGGKCHPCPPPWPIFLSSKRNRGVSVAPSRFSVDARVYLYIELIRTLVKFVQNKQKTYLGLRRFPKPPSWLLSWLSRSWVCLLTR